RTTVEPRLERAKAVTRRGPSTSLASARCAEDRGIVVEASPQQDGLRQAVATRLREALAPRQGPSHEAKSWIVALAQGEHCSFLGCDCRRGGRRRGVWGGGHPPRVNKSP